MSDVRLVGTSPEDGSLVPVAVTPAGLLKTAIGKIEKIPNDVEIDGDLTVTGTINGEQGGGDSLPSGGEEGDVLTIVNGSPAWASPAEPEPEPEPKEDVHLVDNTYQNSPPFFYSSSGHVWTPDKSWDETARGLGNWRNVPSDRPLYGVGKDSTGSACNFPITLDLQNMFGKVLCVSVYGAWYFNGNNGPPILSMEVEAENNTPNMSSLGDRHAISAYGANKEEYIDYTFRWLCNRDVYEGIGITLRLTSGDVSTSNAHRLIVNGWWAEDAGKVALEQQIALREELARLRAQGPATTDS